jgi:hypothetical protein
LFSAFLMCWKAVVYNGEKEIMVVISQIRCNLPDPYVLFLIIKGHSTYFVKLLPSLHCETYIKIFGILLVDTQYCSLFSSALCIL